MESQGQLLTILTAGHSDMGRVRQSDGSYTYVVQRFGALLTKRVKREMAIASVVLLAVLLAGTGVLVFTDWMSLPAWLFYGLLLAAAVLFVSVRITAPWVASHEEFPVDDQPWAAGIYDLRTEFGAPVEVSYLLTAWTTAFEEEDSVRLEELSEQLMGFVSAKSN